MLMKALCSDETKITVSNQHEKLLCVAETYHSGGSIKVQLPFLRRDMEAGQSRLVDRLLNAALRKASEAVKCLKMWLICELNTQPETQLKSQNGPVKV